MVRKAWMTRVHVVVALLAACGGSPAARPDADVVAIDGAVDAPAVDGPIDGATDASPSTDAPPPLGPGWTLLSGLIPPAYRFAHAMAYDAKRGQAVLFGGNAAPPYLGDTWVSDGFGWVQRTPATSPPARSEHAMAYDTGRERVVLFGGRSIFDRFADTWEWDGSTWLLRTPASSPPALYGEILMYDAANARTILFGGAGPQGLQNETWAWDGTTWTKLAPAMSPIARTGAAAVYDAARERIVLFGGASQIDGDGDGLGDLLADTWEWTGTTWTPLTTTDAPSRRAYHAMAYDAGRARTVLFGGLVSFSGTGVRAKDTWEWNGTSWTRQLTSVQPGTRAAHAMAYHPARQAVLVYAGQDTQGISGDLWAFTGL